MVAAQGLAQGTAQGLAGRVAAELSEECGWTRQAVGRAIHRAGRTPRPHRVAATEWQPTERALAVLDAAPRLATGRHPADEPPEMRLTRLANRTGDQGWLGAPRRVRIGGRSWVVLVVDGEVVLVTAGAASLDDYPTILGGRQPDDRQDWDGRGALAVCRAVRTLQLIFDRQRAAAATASPPSATRRRLGRHRTVSEPTPPHRLP